MNRNVNDYFSKTPTPHFPRSRFDMGVHKRLQTQAHGRLTPFYSRIVYPGDTWQMDMSVFVRMDTSTRVPLDDIYFDTYFFFVPFRIIDDNFAKVLGDVDPYDETSYSFPTFGITTTFGQSTNSVLPYLGYSQDSTTFLNGGFYWSHADSINPYSLAAYYKIYNDWFRDENVNPSIPYQDLYGQDTSYFASHSSIFNGGACLYVNKYHDYFTSGMISPQKGQAVTIPLGTSAPVGAFIGYDSEIDMGVQIIPGGDSYESTTFLPLKVENDTTESKSPLVADLSAAAGTINQLRLAFAIQSLYERRGRYGTRYIETIRGQWGIEVPDAFFERPEYLGGSRVTLNNVPVLSTENSSQLGQMAGNSSTLSGGNSFTKTFVEFGVIIGVSTTRVKHSYTQGCPKELFRLKTDLDLYNPVFANIGFMPTYTNELYNQGVDDDSVFNYQEAWANLRTEVDSFAGLFGVVSNNSDLKNLWHYGDYYSSKPTFSFGWLREDFKNVSRTLTGQLIEGAASTTAAANHQFMFGYYFHPVVTRILPGHSVPVELIGRL